MKKVIKKAKGNEYHLIGNLGIMMDGGSDNDYFKGKKLDEVFSAPNDVAAIKKAKEIVEEFIKENKEYYYVGRRPNSTDDPVFEFSLKRIVWKMSYEKSQPGRSAIPAKPAKPEQIAEYVVG
ncbi:hypothetical protein EPN15_04265 [Patescibacteria group bacterium]|nr:MAG: hypothetical protein EPN15_04265 [Patescibacteria group bacterium]